MWRRRTSLIVAFLCLALFVLGVSYSTRKRIDLSSALQVRIQHDPEGLLDFRDIAPFRWDQIFIFRPYSSHAVINKALGFQWKDVEESIISQSDSVNLIVLVDEHRVVHWCELPRSICDLSNVASTNGYTRENAIFQICVKNSVCRLCTIKDSRQK